MNKKRPFLKNIKLKYMLILAFIPLFIIISAFSTIYLYESGKTSVMHEIDQRLFTTASSIKVLRYLDAYHDRITGKDSISDEEELKLNFINTDFANKVNIEFIYTVVADKDKIFFTSSSYSEEEIKKREYGHFFDEYKDASTELRKAVKDKKMHYQNYTDKWGTHRSIFLPTKTEKGREYFIGVDLKLVTIKDQLRKVLIHSALIGIGAFCIVLITTFYISRLITEPLSNMVERTANIAKGNLDIELPAVQSFEELSRMGEAFENMRVALKEYVINLEKTTTAKGRIESELKVAHDIQMSFLPKRFPNLAGNQKIDLFAFLEPAKEVGGDLYDFFFLDEGNMFFSVGDVSDKGVPAAIFMAVTKTLVKGIASHDIEPSEVLRKVNQELCLYNDSLMFVTLFCGILNLKTGNFTFTNAGHNPPIILRSSGEVEWLKLPPGIVLGIDDQTQYKTETSRLMSGDALVAYTDGVTEAMNNERKLFSETRLVETAKKFINADAQEIVKGIAASVREYTAGAVQSDDITIMAIRFKDYLK